MGKPKSAVISVYNKSWITTLGRFLATEGVAIFSSGGTLAELKKKKVPSKPIEHLTGAKEILDGRVKTLHYSLYAGLLADRENNKHKKTLDDIGVPPLDIVIVNFYPFIDKVKARTKMEDARELIDIGGVTLVRAAAKNFPHVVVLVDPDDYKDFTQAWKDTDGEIPFELRRKYALKAFAYCREYDQAIEDYFHAASTAEKEEGERADAPTIELDSRIDMSFNRLRILRYGENPHQRAALYAPSPGNSVPFRVLHNKDLSYNNLQDASGALRICRMPYEKPHVACVIKHVNPCGMAIDDSPLKAIQRAKEGDPVSAYGGILGTSFEIGMPEAKEIAKTFLEVVVAPKFAPEAARELAAKKKLRLVEIGTDAFKAECDRVLEAVESGRDIPLKFASSPFGFLVQEDDLRLTKSSDVEVVSDLPLRPAFKPDVLLGLTAIRFLKSNSIALFKDGMMVGAGMGQPSRVDATKIAIEKAGKRASGAVLVSDGFFPFADSIELANKAGIAVAVAPKGSIRDHEVIQRANDLKLCLVFVPERHFLH